MMLMPVLLAQALSSCSLVVESEDYCEPVEASLAFTVSSTTGTSTRMADAVVQEQTNGRSYRGLGNVYLIPFAISGDQITSSDHPSRLLQNASLLGSYDKQDNYGGFYLYNVYTLNRGINAFLVYGRAGTTGVSAPSGVTDKAYFGSLQVPELVYPDLTTLRFRPDPIYTGTGTPAEAQLLADYLTHIAGASGSSISWSNTTDPTLKSYFLNFTGQENNECLVMAGSTANVIAHVNALYSNVVKLTSDDEGLRDNILSRIQNPPSNGLSLASEGDGDTWELTGIKKTVNEASVEFEYPSSVGLPDGAAALQWGEIEKNNVKVHEFLPRTETSTTASINTITRYCYALELFYYANSKIDTSNEEVSASDYTSATNWTALLNSKYQNKNAIVTGNTQAIAIQQPLQYAVGRLKVSMKAETTTNKLKDAADKDVPLTNPTNNSSSFPLTGIIICNQHPVGFDFKPVLNEGAASHAEDGFIYDTQVGDNLYLTQTEQNINSTLVLQTYDTGEGENLSDAEEVTIIMEFINNSGQKFKGKGGVVYEGTKFYLLGKITPQKKDNAEDYEKRVFTQDYVTSVSTKVETLANAYNVLPDLLGGRLELGIVLNTKWIQAKTTNVPLQ
jgi:hypothetical protein